MNLLRPPIEFPDVPCVFEIPGGVRTGLLVRIQGEPHKHAHRFSVNIAAGSQISPPMSDIGFHFNARFDTEYVARNSLIDENWGDEEWETPSNLPFAKRRSFEIMILVENLHYKVAVDGLHFLQYAHRIPVERLNTLHILGDVNISKLEFLDSNPQPPAYYDFQQPQMQQLPMGLVQPIEIFNPVIPLINEIPGGNRIGLIIRINGKVPKHATEFFINISNGPRISPPRSDIGFHFNPRFDCGYVARNTLTDENWGEEESENPNELPFYRRETFQLSILVESHHYTVSVNGVYFLKYKHRIPIDQLHTLQILGNVKVSKLEFLESKSHQPQLPAYGFQQPPMQLYQPLEILNPAVPFRQVIPGGMTIGKTIFITGRPKPYATRFSINLEKTREVEADIIFHLNPRFGGMNDEKSSVVVRNHFYEGEWGFEDRETHSFPFAQGFNFDLTIVCEQEFYLVAVNGQHLLSFRHRLPFQNVDTIYIVGDVDIMSLRI